MWSIESKKYEMNHPNSSLGCTLQHTDVEHEEMDCQAAIWQCAKHHWFADNRSLMGHMYSSKWSDCIHHRVPAIGACT